MWLMFVDESGDPGPLKPGNRKQQPLLTVLGLCVDHDKVERLTRQWIEVKKKFHPGLCQAGAKTWDWQTAEVKGSEVRRRLRSSEKRERRATVGFLDRTLDLLDANQCRFAARIWIKKPGGQFNGRSVYTSSIQRLCALFESFLSSQNRAGLVIADSRSPAPNVNVAHSIFTQKYSAGGDAYPSLLEVPVFGHSDNHTGLQLADVLASGIVTPMCTLYFLDGQLDTDHLSPHYRVLAERYCPRLRSMLIPGLPTDSSLQSFVVSNPVSRRGSARLFREHGCAQRDAVTLVEPDVESEPAS